MKISEVDLRYVKKYLRIEEEETDEDNILTGIMSAALDYIKTYTALTAEQIDEHEDLTIAYLILCEDMFDNRSVSVKNSAVNRTVSTILSMHSMNNLG